MPQKLNPGQLTAVSINKADKAAYLTGTSLDALTPKTVFDAAASTTITWAATIALNFASSLNWDVVLNGTTTLANPSGLIPGQSGRIRVQQDGNGSRTMSYGSAWKFPNGAPSLSTGANAVDVIAYYVHSTSIIEATFVKAFS